jgi:molybdopterin-guanine dinucleotide biosynthesis adapter protein
MGVATRAMAQTPVLTRWRRGLDRPYWFRFLTLALAQGAVGVFMSQELPVIGFVASSGSGKTTLLRRLVPLLVARGLRIGYLKHAHHGFDLDVPGKDSFELRAAGVAQTLLASDERWALQAEQAVKGQDPDLHDMLRRFDPTGLDLILVEGFKHARYPKIEVYRAAHGRAPLYPEDPDILAVATDATLPDGAGPQALPIDDPQAVLDFILAAQADGRLARGR